MVKVVWENPIDDRRILKVDSKEDFEKSEWDNGYNIVNDYYGVLTVDWDGSLPAYYSVTEFNNDDDCWVECEQITDVKEWCEQMIASYNHVADSLYKFSNSVR